VDTVAETAKFIYEDQVTVAGRCLDAKLNNGRLGTLHDALDGIWDGHRPSPWKVVGLEIKGTLVGCAAYNRRTHQIMVYVHHDHRRRGYGSLLIRGLETTLGISRAQCHAVDGDEGSEAFWSFNDVIVHEDIALTTDEAHLVISGDVSVRTMVKRKRREFRRAWLDRICRPEKE